MRILTRFEGNEILFEKPERIISCENPEKIQESFDLVEKALDRGLFVAGFLSYEAGYALENKFRGHNRSGFPLLYFGCYEKPGYASCLSRVTKNDFKITDLRRNITRLRYNSNIAKIRNYIASGDVYQVTYCLKLLFSFEGDPFSLFRALLEEQAVPYPAFIDTGRYSILSLSPEMFMKKQGTHIVTKPMKGTWQRGATPKADKKALNVFQADGKNRAENIMIVDLLRNDLGRIGSDITVTKFFEITPYKTLFQMTSTIEAEVEKRVKMYDLFKALLPSGSVTGAPKIRAMEIINELEPQPRNIYTGAIGFIKPNRDLFFNIPIRTVLRNNGKGEMGIGGGIVWDSTAGGEWDEGVLKARFFDELVSGS